MSRQCRVFYAALFLLISVLFPCMAELSNDDDMVSMGVDLGFAGDLMMREDVEISGAFRLRLSDEFALKLPVSAVMGGEGVFMDTGLMLVYYPFNTGPFVSLSLIQFGFEIGEAVLNDRIISLNEVSLGWTWNYLESWFAEASVVIRDPSGTYREEYEMIRGAFPSFRTFRIRLVAGWNFLRRPDNG